ncbi:MAG: hypothetical protein U1E22_08630, partial [Coriobacteriia bacterium]|nr:hypothetical protein [Coriobacteriia bacterium]
LDPELRLRGAFDHGLVEDGLGGADVDGTGLDVEADVVGDAFGLNLAFGLDAEGFADLDFELAGQLESEGRFLAGREFSEGNPVGTG